LAWGDQHGFVTQNRLGYAGHLEYGDGEETIGVLVHLDVVPAGEGWRYPPFSGTVSGGKIYGRGAIDDKGPAVAVMYALKALKDCGVKPKKKIRVIYGCDEESGWACMDHYFKYEKKPDYGFTPDASFPLINSEKGQLGLKVEGKVKGEDGGVMLESFTGGTRRNVVPEQAVAVLAFSGPEQLRQGKVVLNVAGAGKIQVQELPATNKLKVVATGVSAHGSTPEQGENAITKLAQVLTAINWQGDAGELIHFINDCLGATDGQGMGIACWDEVSGALTVNLGVIKLENGQVELEMDIRAPHAVDLVQMKKKTEAKFKDYDLDITASSILPPHYLPEDSRLVQTLLRVYREETGDLSKPVATGGRTYAMTLGNGVAFGPVFPGQAETAHQKDEYFAIDDLMTCTRIYAQALYELAKEE
jgi:succinyl-diaminopimelate desuccinylase